MKKLSKDKCFSLNYLKKEKRKKTTHVRLVKATEDVPRIKI